MAPALHRLLLRAAAVALASLASLALAQTPGPGVEKTGNFRVLIGADGKLKSAAPLDASLGDALNRALIGAAKDIAFEPAMRDGQPASFESQLQLNARFVADASGGYRLELVNATLAPQALERRPPIFPRGLDRTVGAVLVMRVAIGPDGRVDPGRTTVLQSATTPGGEKSLELIERASLEALNNSRFQPDLVGGKPVAVEVVQTFGFCVADCGVQEPPPSAERQQLPRIVDAGVFAARVPVSLVARKRSPMGKTLRFRIAVDAAGTVTAVTPTGEGDAALQEATRVRLLATRFFPATLDGRPVSSEMPVTVPVRIENGGAQAQLGRLAVELSLSPFRMPRLGDMAGDREGQIRARLHVITGADGRADPTASRVESLEILPSPPIAVERTLKTRFEKNLRLMRAEPILLDGRSIPLEFWRSHYTSFCSGAGRCEPGSSPMSPPDPPAKLPAGVELARVKP